MRNEVNEQKKPSCTAPSLITLFHHMRTNGKVSAALDAVNVAEQLALVRRLSGDLIPKKVQRVDAELDIPF